MLTMKCVIFLTSLVLIQDGHSLPLNIQRNSINHVHNSLTKDAKRDKHIPHHESSAEQQLEELLTHPIEESSFLEKELQRLHHPIKKVATKESKKYEKQEDLHIQARKLPKRENEVKKSETGKNVVNGPEEKKMLMDTTSIRKENEENVLQRYEKDLEEAHSHHQYKDEDKRRLHPHPERNNEKRVRGMLSTNNEEIRKKNTEDVVREARHSEKEDRKENSEGHALQREYEQHDLENELKRSDTKIDYEEVLKELHPLEEDEEEERAILSHDVHNEKREENRMVRKLQNDKETNDKIGYKELLRELHPQAEDEEEEREVHSTLHDEKIEENEVDSREKYEDTERNLAGQTQQMKMEEEKTEQTRDSAFQEKVERERSNARKYQEMPYSPDVTEPDLFAYETDETHEEEFEKKNRLLSRLELLRLMERNIDVRNERDEGMLSNEDTNNGHHVRRVSRPFKTRRHIIKPFVEKMQTIDDDEVHAYDEEEDSKLNRFDNRNSKGDAERERDWRRFVRAAVL